MSYPSIDKPYGLVPVNLKGGIPFAGSTRMIPIGQGYNTNIFNGDVVGLSNGNAIITPYNADTASAAAAGDIVGVFLGCEYSTGSGPIFGKLRQQYWPAGTNAPDAVGYVLDDPNALFKAAVIAQPQGSANTQLNTGTTVGYMSPSFLGTNAFLIAGNGGSTATGNSLAGVSGGNPTVASSVAGNIRQTVGTGAGTSPAMRVIQLVPETAVTVATALSSSPAGATTFTVASTSGIVPGMQCVIAGISGTTAGSPGSNLTVTGVVTSTSTITVSANVTASSGASVSFIGYPEVIVGWNFGYHSYLLAAGV
jgi:hypothetical protein